ncbi:MAG TPA: glycosyltransferase family 9 protein [Phycisphaerae bacterium]|nr:glycosyltransferase family 9 protein [Phycisphaerae bacterium]HUT59751.1 glycosyltransferase family 9 protein [Phycisphaerae bacterium]
MARSILGRSSRADLRNLQPRRIALIACHWIGDTFWATQVVEPLRRRFPNCELTAITKPFAGDLWHGLIPPQRVVAAPEVVSDRHRETVRWGAILRRAKALRGQRFDLAIDLTGNRYSALLVFRMRPRRSIGFDGGEIGWLYSHRVGDAERPGRHLSERPFRVIEPLLAGTPEPFAYRLPLRPPEPTCPAAEVRSRLGIGNRGYYVLAPGAGWPAKQSPPAMFAEAGRRLGGAAAVVLTGSQSELELCRSVAQAIGEALLVVGRPVGEVVALLSEAAGVLCNDSGVGHLAAALNRPTAAVFTTATNPQMCRPLGPDDLAKVFTRDDSIDDIVAHLVAVR